MSATVLVGQLGPPIDLREVFARQRAGFLALLDELDASDWERPTACEGWTVADIVAHLLGDVLGRVSGGRDGSRRARPRSGESLERFIDRVNGEWVTGCRQLSPRLVIELLGWIGDAHDQLWLSRDLDEPSLGVSWAGIDPAPVWLDAARDLTEYWVHERQICEAVSRAATGIPDVRVVLDVFARGLPYTLGRSELGALSRVQIGVDPSGPSWLVVRDGDRWWLSESEPDRHGDADASVCFDSEALWRRWTRQPGSVGPGHPASPLERAVLSHVAIVHSNPGR